MGVVFRQSAKNAIITVAGASLGALIMWLSAKYIPNKHQFGFTQSLMVNAVIFAQVTLLGFSSTLSVYIHKYSNDKLKRSVLIALCIIVPAIITIIASTFYFIFHEPIIKALQPDDMPLMRHYYGWLPVYTLLFVYQLLMEQYLGSQMKVAVAAFIREIVIRIINIILLFLFAFNFINFSMLVAGIVLMYLCTVITFFALSIKTEAFGFSLKRAAFTDQEYKDIFKFSWYHFLLNVVLMLMGFMDMILLPFYDANGFGAVAIYRYAAFLIVILQMPFRALVPASFSALARAYNENDMPKTINVFSRSSINIWIPTICLAVLLFCNLSNIVAIVPNNYSQIIPIFSILFIGNIVNIGTGMNDQVLSIANYYKFNFYLSFMLIVILYVLLRVFIPRYGIYGAAWSSTITLMLFNICKFLFIWKKVGMQPFSGGTLKVLIAAVPALAAGYFFPYFFEPARHIYIHTFLDAGMRSLIIIIIYIAMLIWLKPSADLEDYLATIRKDKRLF